MVQRPMAALPFAPEALADAEPVERLPRLALDLRTKRGRGNSAPDAAGYRGPTADDWEFYLVRVAKDERTCLGCGETFVRGICPRCGLPEPGEQGGKGRRERIPPSVSTESYLKPEEYRRL